MEMHNQLVAPDRQRPTTGDLLLLGFWVRSAIAGALVAGAGFASLIDPPQGMPYLTALTWIAAGSTFTWLAWQRTVTLIDRIDAHESTQPDRDGAAPKRQVAHVPVSSGRTSPPNRCQPEVS